MAGTLHLLESFDADGDDGRHYVVRGYEHLARIEGVPDPAGSWEPTGLAEYQTASGEPVRLERDGTMTVVPSGVRLMRHA